jgi:hypothetical protein
MPRTRSAASGDRNSGRAASPLATDAVVDYKTDMGGRESGAANVGAAVAATVAAGTARLCHEDRVGSPAGPSAPSVTSGEGWVDLRHRRAWCTGLQTLAGESLPVENYWDGPTLYVRFGASEPWRALPLMGSETWPAGAVAYGSPLWLLDALHGAGEGCHTVGDEPVRAVPTTHIRLNVDVDQALRRSPHGLHVPLTYVEAFPAEVWVDADYRIRRMGCTLPARWRWASRQNRAHWVTTEFWDFGTSVDVPSHPASSARHAEWGPS